MTGIRPWLGKLFKGRHALVISALDHVMEYGDQPGIEDAAVVMRNRLSTDALLLSRFILKRHAGLLASPSAPAPVVRRMLRCRT